MTILEDQLRDELRRFGVTPVPAGRDPDPWVFGDWYPAGRVRGFAFPACQLHQVGWNWAETKTCWCCEDGVPPC